MARAAGASWKGPISPARIKQPLSASPMAVATIWHTNLYLSAGLNDGPALRLRSRNLNAEIQVVQEVIADGQIRQKGE